MSIFCSNLNTIQQWSIIYFQTFAHNTIKIAVISWSTVRPNRGRISRLNTVSIDSFFHTHKPTGQIAAFRIVYGLTPPFGHYLDRVESEGDFLYVEEKYFVTFCRRVWLTVAQCLAFSRAIEREPGEPPHAFHADLPMFSG